MNTQQVSNPVWPKDINTIAPSPATTSVEVAELGKVVRQTFNLKVILLLTMLFGLSFFMFREINFFLLRKDFLMPTLGFGLISIALMTGIALVYSFILCSNNRYIEYFLIPGILCITAVGFSIKNNLISMALLVIAIVILISISVFYLHRVKSTYIKFNPYVYFGYPTKGLLTIFGVYAAFTVFFNQQLTLNFNIGQSVSKLVSEPIQNLVNNQLQSALEQKLSNQLVPSGLPYKELVGAPKIKADEFVTEQVNSFIEPYTNFAKPTLAILVYFTMQFFALLARLLFALFIGPVFFAAKRLGFIKVSYVSVQKEELSL